MPCTAIPQALLLPAALVAALAIAGCEPPPPVELGPQGSGGIVSGASGSGDGQTGTPDGTGDSTSDAGTADGATAEPGDTTTASATTAGSAAGSLLDAGKGAAFAARLAADDARYFQQAEFSAYGGLVGSTVTWRNPGSGTVGTITPLSDRSIGGQDCRDFFITATIGGRQYTETVTACRSGSDWVPSA